MKVFSFFKVLVHFIFIYIYIMIRNNYRFPKWLYLYYSYCTFLTMYYYVMDIVLKSPCTWLKALSWCFISLYCQTFWNVFTPYFTCCINRVSSIANWHQILNDVSKLKSKLFVILVRTLCYTPVITPWLLTSWHIHPYMYHMYQMCRKGWKHAEKSGNVIWNTTN